jgi:hypothetical protein
MELETLLHADLKFGHCWRADKVSSALSSWWGFVMLVWFDLIFLHSTWPVLYNDSWTESLPFTWAFWIWNIELVCSPCLVLLQLWNSKDENNLCCSWMDFQTNWPSKLAGQVYLVVKKCFKIELLNIPLHCSKPLTGSAILNLWLNHLATEKNWSFLLYSNKLKISKCYKYWASKRCSC